MWGRRPMLTSHGIAMLCYAMVWYGMVGYGMVWYGMVGHADPPTPQIWAANMCHIHGRRCIHNQRGNEEETLGSFFHMKPERGTNYCHFAW